MWVDPSCRKERISKTWQYVDLELGVFSGSGALKHNLGHESLALQLLVQTPIGGSFVQPDLTNSVRPSTLVKASHAYSKRMETVWRVLTRLVPNDPTQSAMISYTAVLDSLIQAVPTLCYLYFMFSILTSDVQCLPTSLPSLLSLLTRLDQLRASIRSDQPAARAKTRWSAPEPKAVGISDRICARRFLALSVGGLAAFAALRQRHRHPLLEQLFTIWAQVMQEHRAVDTFPREFVFPSQLTYLLPSRVALERCVFPFSLSNAASLRGLLCPLFLAQFAHQLNSFSGQVGELAANTLVDQISCGPRAGPRAPAEPSGIRLPSLDVFSDPAMLRGSQLESYASCLPVSLELILLSVELERWSSLIAGDATVNEFSGTT
ncbi:unnamed protein product [Echinostoma caproni]|uniref:Uncharacterized protein n=1 Tax=Echinostoma caproni TaxID=27848 RepID=A0A183AIC0_9TREM|nr:unnamed protein product [Echinostoma caproni]